MDEADLLGGLDADQREAVLTDAAPLAILAPAGSGKTRVLTHRIARRAGDGTADPRHVLALTFTRRAAGELQRRLARLGLRDRPTAGTFHGVAWSVLTQRWADLGRPRLDLLADVTKVLGPLVSDRGARGGRPVRVDDVATELSWCRARRLDAASYALEARRHGRRASLAPESLGEVFAAYAEEKRRRRLVDFDDLLELCAGELARDPAFADAQRWRFRHLFVDEFQDVNPLQFHLLEAWRGGRPDLCVVGDPSQAIYGWNGADPTLLERFADLVGGATVVRLRRTYRSTPQVVATARQVLGDGEATVVAVRPDGPAPRVHAYATAALEASGIARLVGERRPGRRWGSCAVLVRTHAQVGPIAQAMAAAGIPVRSRHGRTVLERPAVQAALRGADAGEPLLAWVHELELELAAGAASSPDGETRLDGAEAEAVQAERADRALLVSLARELLVPAPAATVGALRTWLATGGDDGASRADGVDVLTFHAAKGLEWPVVVVAGVEAGLVPHASATTEEARSEEARLLHVALSRAEQELHVTWAASRGTGSGRRVRRPSPLLAAIEAAGEPAFPAPPPPDLRAATPPPAATGATRAARDAAATALDALRRWRSSTALAAGLPESAVCTDGELAELAGLAAQHRPVTLADLSAVLGPLAARRFGDRLLPVLAGGDDRPVSRAGAAPPSGGGRPPRPPG